MKFNETLECSILKESADAEKHMVVAGVLEGDFLSANGRFYPESIVQKASETLVGKPSMIGHDTNSPRDVVARIVNARMSGKKLVAEFQFGKDASSQEMFQKVAEGLVNSYSIRAWGESRPGKVNGEDVDIVHELNIETVDLVVTPGISSAKVMKVYRESAPDIQFNKENDMEVKELQEKLDEATKQLKASEDARLALEEANKKAEEAKKEAELKKHIAEKLATVAEEFRTDIEEACDGSKTIEEFDAKFEKSKKTLEKLAKKAKVEVVISPTDKKEEKKHYKSVNDTLEDATLSKEDKAKILTKMLGGNVK